MPRLTNPDYLDTHHKLRRLWLHDPNLYSELTPNEQWSLHDFFVPDLDWSDERLIERRHVMSKIHPSLPQKAGRALEKFWGTTATHSLRQVQAAKAPATKTTRRLQEDRRLTVRGLARPQPDVKLLAKAFVGLAIQRAKEQNFKRGQVSPPSAHDARVDAKSPADD